MTKAAPLLRCPYNHTRRGMVLNTKDILELDAGEINLFYRAMVPMEEQAAEPESDTQNNWSAVAPPMSHREGAGHYGGAGVLRAIESIHGEDPGLAEVDLTAHGLEEGGVGCLGAQPADVADAYAQGGGKGRSGQRVAGDVNRGATGGDRQGRARGEVRESHGCGSVQRAREVACSGRNSDKSP